MLQKTKYRFSIRKFSIGTGSVLLGAFLFVGFQDVAHASELHNSTLTTDTASNPQSFEKKANNSTHEDVQNAASTYQSNPLKNTENTTKAEIQSQITSKTTHSVKENANAQAIAASSQIEKKVIHTRSRRSATSPITSEGVLEDTTTTATPNMDDANGASVKSRDVAILQPKDSNTVPTPNVVFEKSPDPNQYTFAITDLKDFNAAYQTKYYYRLSKPYDDSNDVTIELVNGETNTVVETKQINSPGTVSIGQNSLEIAVAAHDPQKAKYGHINFTFLNTLDSFKNTVSTIRARFEIDDNGSLEDRRSGIQIYDLFNQTNEGTTITDPQYYVSHIVPETTYYRVVTKNNPTYQADKTDINAQTYQPDFTEKELAHYTIKGMDGQIYTASNSREFEGYKLYQIAEPNHMIGTMVRPYQVGLRYVDAETNNGGVKRIKEIIGEDGTTRIEIWTLSVDHMSESAKNTGIDTTNYVKVYEATLRPGERNKNDLGKQIYIPGYNIPFLIQPASAGEGAVGNIFAPNQSINGVQVGRGSNFRLQNLLAKAHPIIYYYTAIDPVEVTLKANKVVKGEHTLAQGEFTFNIVAGPNSPAIPETSQSKTNAADGSVTFDKISFTKPGTYTYTITENKANLNSNFDAEPLTITATVTVTEENVALNANVSYAYDSDTDNNQAFTNYYVAPKQLDFDVHFTKSLVGRPLNNEEFQFTMKNADGEVIATGTNNATGQINFNFIEGKRPTYTNADAGKTFTYTVEEVPSNLPNINSDSMKAIVTVNITKDLHVLTATSIAPADTEFNNTFVPPTPPTPVFQPEKFDLSVEKYDITANKLLDDDSELANKYADTNVNPYADQTTNNEPENINTKTLNRGDKIVYQVWLDTTHLTPENKINKLGITDDYDETSVAVQSIKVYDGITGQDVTNLFDITDENGVIIATSKDSLVKDHVLDNAQMPFGRYYKLDIVGVIKDSAKASKDITNVANQSVQFFNPAKGGNEVPPPKPSEKRVNKVKPVPVNFEFKVTKKLEGGQLKGGDYTFILTDLNTPDHPEQSATNDANGKVNFLPIKFNKVGTYIYQITEQVGTDSNIAYDTMSIKSTVVVTENPETGNLQATVTYNSSGGKSVGINDTEFNNTVKPPVPPTPNKPPHNPPKTPGQPPVNPPGNPPEKPGVPPTHHVPPTPKQLNQPKHLPNTGSDDANINKSLLATMFASLGSVLLFGRRRRDGQNLK